jgi:hypothetical protein
MNNRIYLTIGLIVLVFIAGCVENTSPKSSTDVKIETTAIQTQNPVVARATHTPVPTSANKVVIEHYPTQMDKLTKYVLSNGPEYQYPSPGMTYMVVNLKITNQGYPMIKVNQFQWSLKVSTKDNPNAYTAASSVFYGKEDGIECKDTELENGGWTTCKIPFEVPTNHDQYKLYWNGFNDANIEWKYTPQ